MQSLSVLKKFEVIHQIHAFSRQAMFMYVLTFFFTN